MVPELRFRSILTREWLRGTPAANGTAAASQYFEFSCSSFEKRSKPAWARIHACKCSLSPLKFVPSGCRCCWGIFSNARRSSGRNVTCWSVSSWQTHAWTVQGAKCDKYYKDFNFDASDASQFHISSVSWRFRTAPFTSNWIDCGRNGSHNCARLGACI